MKHLMTGLTGNREFCFPKFLNVPLGDRLQVQVGAKVTGHPKTQTMQTADHADCAD